MKQRKYTLPRHTNLASTSKRIGAFIVDLAMLLAITLVFYFGCFNLIFKSKTKPYQDALHKEQLNSHLRIIGEDGNITQISKDSTYVELSETISYFYLNFLTGKDIEPEVAFHDYDKKVKIDGNEVMPNEFFVVEWYNENILHITSADPDNDTKSVFTYQKDGSGNYDKTVIGIPRTGEGAIEANAADALRYEYRTAYEYLINTDYMVEINNKLTFRLTAEFVASAIIGIFVVYILIPLFMHNGQTLGKKVFKLALANSEGFSMKDSQLLMRAMPSAVVTLSLLIPIWSDMLYLVIVVLVVFLVSFALAMASPKHSSLHDFTARTIVIDNATSIIFDNQADEDEYTAKEDNLEPIQPEEENGEEPELRYEK